MRSSTIVLYFAETGADGQKVPTATLGLPLPIIAQSPSGTRVAIHTVEGVRWIAVADVVLSSQSKWPPSTGKQTGAKSAPQ